MRRILSRWTWAGLVVLALAMAGGGASAQPRLVAPEVGWGQATPSDRAVASLLHHETGTRVELLRLEVASTPDGESPTPADVVDAWLMALTAPDPRVQTLADEVRTIAGHESRAVSVRFADRVGVMVGLPQASPTARSDGSLPVYVLTCEGPDDAREAVLAACDEALATLQMGR